MLTLVNYGYLYSDTKEILICVSDEDEYYVFLEDLSQFLFNTENNNKQHNLYTDIVRNYDDIHKCIYSLYPEDMNEDVINVVYKNKTYKRVKHFLPIDDCINYLTIKTKYCYSLDFDTLDFVLSDLVDLSNNNNLTLCCKTFDSNDILKDLFNNFDIFDNFSDYSIYTNNSILKDNLKCNESKLKNNLKEELFMDKNEIIESIKLKLSVLNELVNELEDVLV